MSIDPKTLTLKISDERIDIGTFIKGGECKERYIASRKAWSDFYDAAENKEDALRSIAVQKFLSADENNKEDVLRSKCFQEAAALKMCMKAHPNYYQPLFKAAKEYVDPDMRAAVKQK